MPPTFAHGKICYVEIPVTDLNRSVAFYRTVFGWSVRQRGDGSLAFDDGVGEVSGTWILGRPPLSQLGLLLYIMVDSVAATLDAVIANGGEVVQPIGADAPEVTACGSRSCRQHYRPLPRAHKVHSRQAVAC